MENLKVGVLSMFKEDIHQSHLDIIAKHGYRTLFEFTSHMAKRYKVFLDIKPKYENSIRNWNIVLPMLGSEIQVNHGKSGKEFVPSEFINQGKLKTHFRRAHTCKINGHIYLRLGAIVNAHLLTDAELEGFTKLLNEYNDRVRAIYEATYEVISIHDWMDLHNKEV